MLLIWQQQFFHSCEKQNVFGSAYRVILHHPCRSDFFVSFVVADVPEYTDSMHILKVSGEEHLFDFFDEERQLGGELGERLASRMKFSSFSPSR